MNTTRVTTGIILLTLLVLSMTSCSKTIKIFEIPEDPNYFFASTTSTSPTAEGALDKATEAAKLRLADQMQSKVEGLFKRFREETGISGDAEMLDYSQRVSKSVVSEVLKNYRVVKQDYTKEGMSYRAVVLALVLSGQMYEELDKKLQGEEHTYTQFKATEAFKELEQEVKKYEVFKKKQGLMK